MVFPILAVAAAAASAYGSYAQAEAQKKAAKQAQEQQANAPMFGAPRLAPGSYTEPESTPPPGPMQPEVGPDLDPTPQPSMDARTMLQQLLSGTRTSG